MQEGVRILLLVLIKASRSCLALLAAIVCCWWFN